MKNNYHFHNKVILYLSSILLPNYIGLSLSVDSMKQFNIDLLNLLGLTDLLMKYQTLTLLFLGVLVPFGLYLLISAKINSNMQHDFDLMTQLQFAMTQIITIKKKVIVGEMKLNKAVCSGGVCLAHSVMKPDGCIIEIMTQLSYSMREMHTNSVKVSLIEVFDDHMKDPYVFHSEEAEAATISILELNTEETTAREALTTKKLILISDVSKPSKHWFFNKETTNIKSIVCYPILYGSEVKYIVCMTSSSARMFKKSMKAKYKYILDEYGSRIMLETHISNAIKGKESCNAKDSKE